jgi:hypothetical protein
VTAPADFIHEILNCFAKTEMMAVRLRAHCYFDCSRRIRPQRQGGVIVKNNEMLEPGNFAAKAATVRREDRK